MNTGETFQCAVGKLIFVFGDFEELLSQGDLIKIEDIEALTNALEFLRERFSNVNSNLHVLDIHDTTK